MDDERCSFPARTGAWPAVREFVVRRCGALALPRSAALRLELIAEELFINAVEHGCRGDDRMSIGVALVAAGPEVELVLEDEAVEFNPFVGVETPSASADPDGRPVGRLGRALVVGLSVRQKYARIDGRNRVTVAVARTAGVAHYG